MRCAQLVTRVPGILEILIESSRQFKICMSAARKLLKKLRENFCVDNRVLLILF